MKTGVNALQLQLLELLVIRAGILVQLPHGLPFLGDNSVLCLLSHFNSWQEETWQTLFYVRPILDTNFCKL